MEYKAIYKCRLCGETYASGVTAGERVAILHMAELIVGVRGREPMAPAMLVTHHCGGPRETGLGLADFQGWKRTKEE